VATYLWLGDVLESRISSVARTESRYERTREYENVESFIKFSRTRGEMDEDFTRKRAQSSDRLRSLAARVGKTKAHRANSLKRVRPFCLMPANSLSVSMQQSLVGPVR
jgi:hypothetical protein